MKIGANGIIVFDADTIDIESVESAIFTLKGIGTITKNYPSKDVSFDNGKFFVGLSQEDTITISANKRVRAEAEAQINYKDKHVAKSDIVTFMLDQTLGTAIIEGNAPTDNIETLHLKYQGEAIIINGEGLVAADGKSAYELAVENGFNGTVEEWLDSLKGGGESGGGTDVAIEDTPIDFTNWGSEVNN